MPRRVVSVRGRRKAGTGPLRGHKKNDIFSLTYLRNVNISHLNDHPVLSHFVLDLGNML